MRWPALRLLLTMLALAGLGGLGLAGFDPGGGAILSCRQAQRLGVGPIGRDAAGYASWLDEDGDGIACERNRAELSGHGQHQQFHLRVLP